MVGATKRLAEANIPLMTNRPSEQHSLWSPHPCLALRSFKVWQWPWPCCMPGAPRLDR